MLEQLLRAVPALNPYHSVLSVVFFAVGLLLIVKGGDWFVDAASWMAEVSGIPKFIIGATVVSVATTMPELIVSVIAASEGNVEIAAGNAIGSVTANIGLIMGISVVCMPSPTNRRHFMPKAVLMLTAGLVLAVNGAVSGSVGILPSVILITVFGLYIADNVRSAKSEASSEPIVEITTGRKTGGRVIAANIIKFAVGTACIVIGANLLVEEGSYIATDLLNVPEGIVAVTLVAIGTSLPELVTTITALVKRESALSIGNIIGANVIDLSLILPLCSAVSGKALPLAAQTTRLDIPFCLAVGVIAVVPPMISKRFRRWQGFALLGVYSVYLVLLCTVFSH